MWFEKLTGFEEESPEQVRANLTVADGIMTSKVNGQSFRCGILETLSLGELRAIAPSLNTFHDKISVSEIIGDVKELHQDENNSGALFQVASQFNLLEMLSPNGTPEEGVGIYEYDGTQGPACAVACGAGTIYRNYFAKHNGQIGQTSGNQIDCLQGIGNVLGNIDSRLWKMQNGYALANRGGLLDIAEQIQNMNEAEYNALMSELRIGIQWDTQVTFDNCKHTLTQAYCSALPVSYSEIPSYLWTDFAKLILNATYEATLYTGLLNYQKTGNNKVFLTLVGGGAFGNEDEWIISAIKSAIDKFSKMPLDIQLVSYRKSKAVVRELVDSFLI